MWPLVRRTKDTEFSGPPVWLGVAACGLVAIAGCAREGGTSSAVRFPRPPGIGRVDITVAVDQVPFHPALPADQTLAILIESGGRTVLFDAGGQGTLLVDNLQRLGKDPRRIEAVVISHFAEDHLTGLGELLRANPDVPLRLPEEAPPDFWHATGVQRRQATVTREPTAVVPGIATTGALPHDAGGHEQALVVHTPLGPVLVVACGHPGHVVLARRAMELTGEPLLMVAGGFHFAYRARPFEKRREVAGLRALSPRYVAPFHCTVDDPAVPPQIATAWGPACLKAGNGALIRVGPAAAAPQVIPAPTPAATATRPA